MNNPLKKIMAVTACLALPLTILVCAGADDENVPVDPRAARAMGYEAIDHGWSEPSILRHARQGDSLEFGRALRGGQSIEARDIAGNTPLHWAVFTHRPALVQEIIRQKADVNVANDKGETPLHWAARHGSGKMVELLVDNGADPAVADKHGNSPLQDARKLQRHDIVALLKNNEHGGD